MENPLFQKLAGHLGHKIECVWYGPKSNPENVAIECVKCGEVLVDASPELENEENKENTNG